MENIQASGQYSVKETGEVMAYSFEYPVYSKEDGCKNVDILKLANRQAKVDANNVEREKVRTANGHSTRAVQTPEQKEKAKASRKADKDLLAKLKSNPDLLAKLGL